LYGSVSKAGHFYYPKWEETFDETSDYDFAVQSNQSLKKRLLKDGWKKKQELSYQDSFTEEVYVRVFEGELVQISAKSHLPHFQFIWERIPASFYWKFLNKRSPTYLGAEHVCELLNQYHDISVGAAAPPKPIPDVVEQVGVLGQPIGIGFAQVQGGLLRMQRAPLLEANVGGF
jgi:hypothetical protein